VEIERARHVRRFAADLAAGAGRRDVERVAADEAGDERRAVGRHVVEERLGGANLDGVFAPLVDRESALDRLYTRTALACAGGEREERQDACCFTELRRELVHSVLRLRKYFIT